MAITKLKEEIVLSLETFLQEEENKSCLVGRLILFPQGRAKRLKLTFQTDGPLNNLKSEDCTELSLTPNPTYEDWDKFVHEMIEKLINDAMKEKELSEEICRVNEQNRRELNQLINDPGEDDGAGAGV
jgi:hypothetical protein